jgi:16S rRNA (cytidine1402-2'-O)-methyltransferase
MKPVVYVIALPIGNLGDITERALATLREVDVLACEDTRMTRKLLSHFQILDKKLVSYHNHGEREKAHYLLDQISAQAESLGLVSDAGTPCLSDPGFHIIQAAHERGIRVIPIPGASSFLTLISAAGLPSDRILFVGFLPRKGAELRKEMESWREGVASIVFFESALRIQKTLVMLGEVYPEAELCIGRELTKLHEEIRRMSVSEAKAWAEKHPCLKGELAVMVGKPVAAHAPGLDWAAIEIQCRAWFAEGKTHKAVLTHFLAQGIPKKDLYRRLLEWLPGPF